MRAVKWVVAFLVLGGAGWIGYKWYQAEGASSEAFNLIPSDAIYCIASDHPIESWKDLAGSGAWQFLQKNTYFGALTTSVNSLDSLIHQNDLLFELIGSRAVVVSAHPTGSKTYDFLFLVDLAGASGIKFVNEYMTTFTAAGMTVKKETYNGQDLISLHNPDKNTDLFVSMPGTYLIASFSRKIINASLDAQSQKNTLAMETFQIAEPSGNDLIRLYLNYAMLPQFMRCYSEGTNEYVDRLSKALRTSTLTFTLKDEMIKATGPTYVNDSVESYLKTLAISGRGATEITGIAPGRTGFYLGFGFSSFQEFFVNFEKNLKADLAEYKSYRQNLQQVEQYLKINLQENFISWIGDEVALIELQSSGKGLDNETAVVIKAENIEKARKNLAYIEKMIRRRTPVKFKSIDHQGYSINYLSMKGLFSILFGKFFARFDKPYYTVINNFVIFSNHPQTLESIIDDYLKKNTLAKSEEFKEFRKEFDDEGSVFAFINTPVLFNSVKKLADASTRSSMERNKEFIVCFRQVGFQLAPDGGRFKTTFAEYFVEPEERTVIAAVPEKIISPDSVEVEESVQEQHSQEEADAMALPYIYVQNLNISSHTGYFPDSTVNFKVELKGGFKDGAFTEYYPGGETKMTGRFKSDKRQGTWKLFDENGKLKLKRNYDGGEVTKEKTKN